MQFGEGTFDLRCNEVFGLLSREYQPGGLSKQSEATVELSKQLSPTESMESETAINSVVAGIHLRWMQDPVQENVSIFRPLSQASLVGQ